MYPYHHVYRCGRATSRFFWFAFGAVTATWWHTHHDVRGWHEARACLRDRIPQDAYPAPGAAPAFPTPPPADHTQNASDAGQARPHDGGGRWGWGWGWNSWPREQQEGQGGRDDRGGWGGWHREARAQQEGERQRWGHGPWQRDPRTRQEGAWGPPMPPAAEKAGQSDKDIVQQATDTITELSEATLNNLLATVESLKAKLAEHRVQREQQERELQALREAKFKQFEEWQRQQQEQQAKEKAAEPPRRLV
ncbi:hypothetical protein C8Q78DRAFT_1004844 [Trametes maxima]|nr:hypothetical protein C8Q78DRAFT_1004844 [Trametes maxima]